MDGLGSADETLDASTLAELRLVCVSSAAKRQTVTRRRPRTAVARLRQHPISWPPEAARQDVA